jgi:serine/threonine protein kinase
MPGHLRPGERVDGRFTATQDLGEEEGVRHYRVHDGSGGPPALLRLAPEVRPGEDDVVQERLRQEASLALQTRAAGALPALIASGDWQGRPYLVTEEWPETRLASLVREGRGLTESRLLAPIAWQLASGLAAVHALGHVHRLIHLGQVRVEVRGPRTRAIWTGLRLIETETGRASWLRVRAGRLAFVAPELFAHDRARKVHGPAADRFALGVLLYHLASGGWPVERPEAADYALRLQIRGPTPLPAGAPVDARQREVVMALLSGLPSRRPPLEEVRAAWAAGEASVLAVSPRPASPPAPVWAPPAARNAGRPRPSGALPASPPPPGPPLPPPREKPGRREVSAARDACPEAASNPPPRPPPPSRRRPIPKGLPPLGVDPGAPTMLPPDERSDLSETGPPSMTGSEDDFTPPPHRGEARPHPGLALDPDGPYTHALHDPPEVWAPRVPRAAAPEIGPAPLGERFVPLDVIGVGTRGAVFRGRDRQTGREVALKVALAAHLPLFSACEPLAVQADQTLPGPVLTVLGHGAQEGRAWAAIELADGPTLETAVTRRGPCQPLVLAWLAESVARALATVQQVTGQAHGNLTPGNVFLCGPQGTPRLSEPGPEPRTGLLARGTDVLWRRLGLAAFAAPELLLGQPADRATDLYALAALCFFLVSARAPHAVSDPRELLDARLQGPPQPPTALQLAGNEALWNLLLRALHPDRGRRPPDLQTFIHSLRKACQAGGARA